MGICFRSFLRFLVCVPGNRGALIIVRAKRLWGYAIRQLTSQIPGPLEIGTLESLVWLLRTIFQVDL